MARIRSILIDATQGKIFTGSDTTANASSANLIAGTMIKSLIVAQGTGTDVVKVATNIGSGVSIASKALLTSVVANVVTAPKNLNITIYVKKASTYASATTIATLYITPNTLTGSVTNLLIPILTSEKLFFDIVQVGTVQPGVGFTLTYNYYSGY